jgi:serine/threonine protein kinase
VLQKNALENLKMSNKIGRFEIVSQLAQSPLATVYKALDTETQRTVALKVIDLYKAEDRAALVKGVFEESDQAKPLNSHNIAVLYGVGDEGDQLLAATEYVQGNSVATTLARRDGFSIWDLQDIARQVCHALDHAQVHHVVHHSLEPAKIMVQWDGLVKVLGFGISSMNSSAMNSSAMKSIAVPEVLHYSSPEQLGGESCDLRSTLFSLGVVLYEMATEQKAFGGETPEQLRTAILESTPPLPVRLKPNVNPGLSDLIMKTISKSPDDRYQSGQELVRALEQCKQGASGLTRAAAQPPKAQSAAAFAGAPKPTSVPKSNGPSTSAPPSPSPTPTPKITASAAPAAAPAPKPNFAVDPMMAEEGVAAAARASFSEIDELPPLKEVYVAPPRVHTETEEESQISEPLPEVTLRKARPQAAKVQVREAAQKAVAEIRKTPPKLYLYAGVVALVLIAAIIAGITLHNYLEDRVQRESAGSAPEAAPVPPATGNAAPKQAQPTEPAAAQSADTQPEAMMAEEIPTGPAAPSPSKRNRSGKAKAAAPAVAGQLSITSNPAGAQIAFDGTSMCVTPCTLTGIAPGQHVVAASKAGYSAESRTISLSSGDNSSVAIELNQLAAKVSISSAPAGAVVLVDGKDSGKLTPTVLSFDKPGAHTLLVRRYGYLEETSSVNAEAGQTTALNLNLKPLGSTDEIRAAGGKFKKVFGRGDTSAVGTVSIKTQPKGAQIMVNNRVLDKAAPFDFYLNPGTYVIDITMSGYRSLHRVVNVEQGERVTIEVTLSPE